ncbi:hypothetical protein EC973_005025 [Apophysomyces ossiformis]|uniref:Uncharacterized protein n=1 Tax=Apophysomyces ossiformis TaxID=679940 RepID=A0A8H7ESY5_9FUNG|nr:hypothetical protein EC973_005025 [Apophysomyces ossiformis]
MSRPKKRRLQYDDMPQASDYIPLNSVDDAKNALTAEFFDFVISSIHGLQQAHDREVADDDPRFWDRPDEKLDDLHNRLLAKKRVPRGTLQKIEDKAGLKRNSFGNKFKQQFRFVDLWKEFVKSEFQTCRQTAYDDYLSGRSVQSQPNAVIAPKNEQIRTCSTSIESILNIDIKKDESLKKRIISKLNSTSVQATDLSSDLSAIVFQTMLKLAVGSGEDKKSNKLKATSILPLIRNKEVLDESGYFYPLPPTHLQYLHAAHFSANGPKETTKESHPSWTLLSLEADWPDESGQRLPFTVSSEVVSQYGTNFKNMWSGNLFTVLLNHVLRILLRLHLSPGREHKYVDMVAKKAEEKLEKQSLTKKCTSEKKNLRDVVRREKHKISKLRKKLQSEKDTNIKKKLERKISTSEGRLKYFLVKGTKTEMAYSGEDSRLELLLSHLPQHEALEMIMEDSDDEDSGSNGDMQNLNKGQMSKQPDKKKRKRNPDTYSDDKETSRRKQRSIQAVLRKLLLVDMKGTLTADVVNSNWDGEDLTTKEMDTVLLIYRNLHSFVPVAGNKAPIASQIPFVLLANAILRATGYDKFTRSVCPYVRPSQIHAIALDSCAIYQLFGKRQALGYKRAVFGSLFDLDAVDRICEQHGLQFRERITITSFKTAIITGSTSGKKRRPESSYESRKKLRRNRQPQAALKGSQAELKTDIQKLTGLIKQHEANTKRISREVTKEGRDVTESKKEIITLSRLRAPNLSKKKSDMISRLRQAKRTRAEKQLALNTEKRKLSDARARKYQARKALEMLQQKDKKKRKKAENSEPDDSFPTLQKPGCEDFAQHMKLDKLPDSSITYAGTDYGVVTMSTTVSIPPPRYNFHMELYNRYQTLDGSEDKSSIELDTDKKRFLQLPKPFRSTAADLDWTTRSRAARKSRERRKKTTPEGRAVVKAEKLLSENSIKWSNTVAQANERHKIAQNAREPLRTFYQSNVELKNRKYLKIKKDQI